MRTRPSAQSLIQLRQHESIYEAVRDGDADAAQARNAGERRTSNGSFIDALALAYRFLLFTFESVRAVSADDAQRGSDDLACGNTCRAPIFVKHSRESLLRLCF